ncbi:GYD domain-containing protein [Halococcus agarilyticus]|uniref:GYD domain-containing protein n=1 Tax=Halococcus agarilyticus TaxID=1232219 RepID=UPI0006779C0A|nr:GYD domain-containing protein [Halococcus agarilyticus]
MANYVSMVKIRNPPQNAQKLASVWGDVDHDLREYDIELTDSYAVLGEYDFLLLFDAPSRDELFKAAFVVENYGLDMQTMEIIPIDELASIVDE